jgi:glutamate synthase (NADPH/NADH) large chain
MMRKCHLNTCPVGVATQDPLLREKFKGKADYLVNYLNFIAEEVREILAELGFKTFDEIVGRADLLVRRTDLDDWKTKNLDLSPLMFVPSEASKFPVRHTTLQEHKIDSVMDHDLIKKSEKALDSGEKVQISSLIRNTDRTVGAMLSGRISEKYGEAGLEDATIRCDFKGSAGQSFGAFLAPGVEFRLEGDSNDYLGKGLSGGRIVVIPPKGSVFAPEENIIIGNTVLYGATKGEIYINGVSGERFCVRNSGAIAVVEGVGDHCCEYMTGGITVVLGSTGKNFAAGMSGGIAYVLNVDGNFDYFCNMGMVELSLVEDRSDVRELKNLIQKHHQFTGSPFAGRILSDWENYIDRFIKVIPYEYKKVIEEEKLEALKKKIEEVETDVEIKSV